MPRCADAACGRWRPNLAPLGRLGAPATLCALGALQFNGGWYCSRACVEHAARTGLAEPAAPAMPPAPLPPLKLGVLLRHAGVITQPQLDTALQEAKRTGLRLGEQLERLGYATPEEVLRALAAQSGVSYLSSFHLARVDRGPASLLPAAIVRALGLIPFEADEVLRRLSVICAAPVPKAAMRALVRLTNWTPEVYLVTDRIFQVALQAYRPAEGAAAAHQALTVDGLAAAAAHVADVAVHERVVTMRHADCKDYRLVRVQGSQRVSDLLLAREETGCQAELTAH
jgi:hypothetical protein